MRRKPKEDIAGYVLCMLFGLACGVFITHLCMSSHLARCQVELETVKAFRHIEVLHDAK